MLSIRDVPDTLEALYERSKNLSRDIYTLLQGKGRLERLPVDVDLLRHAAPTSIYFVIEGYFKLAASGKVLRLYSGGDWFAVSPSFAGYTLSSEFASEVMVFDKEDIGQAIRKEKGLAEKWLELHAFEASIDLGLCALSVESNVDASFEFRQFRQGQVITKEGGAPDGIYEMVAGEAMVTSNGKLIGKVNAGEIFGEISFLTNKARTATVTAASSCFVRIVKQDDFAKLIESNPYLIISISKTLAKRIVDLNRRVAELT
ncbi:MAG: cyclic nucleotide-binding domain-containing protein [Myxococcota bacterium]|jgi:CRP-like cAMP-binding protein|nr:cyclic nucleotide-binding domain-containing protein [Myxococcota bacterium]